MSKKLIIYFSATSIIKAAAQRLAKVTTAYLCEIRPAVPHNKTVVTFG